MFTGIVQAVGRLGARRDHDGDCTLTVEASGVSASRGDSICVSGVCLTVTSVQAGAFSFDVSAETLAHTTLGQLHVGAPLNLESAATPATVLGGHIVSGHVDGVAEVTSRTPDARSVRFELEMPARLARYLAPKGSVCVDGVSLTVNAVDGARFDVNIVPHTLQATTMGVYEPGVRVNLEVDVIARYVERLLDVRAEPQA